MKTIEIQKEVKIEQDGKYDIILEKGDKIEIVTNKTNLNERIGVWQFVNDMDNPHLTYKMATGWLEIHKDGDGGFNLYVFKDVSFDTESYYEDNAGRMRGLLRKLGYRHMVPQKMLDDLPVSPEW